jgi:tRNA-dihydrouridine synthase 1
LSACKTLDDVERLLRVKVERWRGRAPRPVDEENDSDEESQVEVVEDFGSLFLE